MSTIVSTLVMFITHIINISLFIYWPQLSLELLIEWVVDNNKAIRDIYSTNLRNEQSRD